MKQDYFLWPETGQPEFVFIVVALLVAGLIFIFTRQYYKNKTNISAMWRILYDYFRKHDLTEAEIAILQVFADRLSSKAINAIVLSKREFHKQLFEYFHRNKQIDRKTETRILDKLFGAKQMQIEVHSQDDLFEGEDVAIESKKIKFLAQVVRKRETHITLSTVEQVNVKETPCQLYVYRPTLGSYLIPGTVTTMGATSVKFMASSKAEAKGDIHLMARLNLTALLEPWPPVEAVAPAATDLPEPAEPGEDMPLAEEAPPAEPMKITLFTISDRAGQFSPDDVMAFKEQLASHDVWQLSATLPDGFSFVCRGKILASKMNDQFIIRFIDLSAAAKRVLFYEIRQNNPEREKIF